MSGSLDEPADADHTPVLDRDFWLEDDRMSALFHPLRVRAYLEAVRGPVSAKELAERLDVPLQRMSYHVRTLADAGLLKVVRRTPRRGAVETHYRAVAALEVETAHMLDRPAEFRTWYRIVWSLVAEDVDHALAAGAGEKPHFVMSRLHLCLDEAGRERLREEYLAFYDRLAALAQEAGVSPEEGGEEVNIVLGRYDAPRAGGRHGPIWMSIEDDRETVPEE